jgi:hypothetical protein
MKPLHHINRTMFIARVIETLVVVPVLFVVFERMSDRKVLAFIITLSCLLASDWMRECAVQAIASRKQRRASQRGDYL